MLQDVASSYYLVLWSPPFPMQHRRTCPANRHDEIRTDGCKRFEAEASSTRTACGVTPTFPNQLGQGQDQTGVVNFHNMS